MSTFVHFLQNSGNEVMHISGVNKLIKYIWWAQPPHHSIIRIGPQVSIQLQFVGHFAIKWKTTTRHSMRFVKFPSTARCGIIRAS